MAPARTPPRCEVEAALRRALELDPERPEAHLNLALLLLDGRPEEAARRLRRAVELRPVPAESWYRLPYARLRLGQNGSARAALLQAPAVDPDHPGAAAALRLLERAAPAGGNPAGARP